MDYIEFETKNLKFKDACYKNYLLKEFVQVLEIEKALEEKFWLESLHSLNFRDIFVLDILKFFLESIKEKFPEFQGFMEHHPDFLEDFSGKNSGSMEHFEEEEDDEIFVVFENLKNPENSEKLDHFEEEDDDEIFVVFENLGNWEKCELCKQKVAGRFMEFFHENAKIEVCRICYGQLQRGLLFEAELLEFSKNFGIPKIPKKPEVSRKNLAIMKRLVFKKPRKRRNRKRNNWKNGIIKNYNNSKKPKIQELGKSGKFGNPGKSWSPKNPGRRGRPKKLESAELPEITGSLHSKNADIIELPNLEIDESEVNGIQKIQNQIFAENFFLEIEQIDNLPVLELDDVDFQTEPKESGNHGPNPGPKRTIAQLFQIPRRNA
ncbi:hypothetical protein B9Z55_021625 [Caenorhabditis nigoni]|uniref:Uncharacterized protein n=1 Tax=Caenorhabditis nigoni TaxID=1611254 RepID=A0A2G5TTE1_9PELO|nr:hypothetical protein B9Z55_021625 [Caenorhabditis nigoni]